MGRARAAGLLRLRRGARQRRCGARVVGSHRGVHRGLWRGEARGGRRRHSSGTWSGRCFPFATLVPPVLGAIGAVIGPAVALVAPQYTAAIGPARLFLLSGAAMGLVNLAAVGAVAARRQTLLPAYAAGALAVNFGLATLALAAGLGLEGAAAASLTGYLVFAAAVLRLNARLSGILQPERLVARALRPIVWCAVAASRGGPRRGGAARRTRRLSSSTSCSCCRCCRAAGASGGASRASDDGRPVVSTSSCSPRTGWVSRWRPRWRRWKRCASCTSSPPRWRGRGRCWSGHARRTATSGPRGLLAAVRSRLPRPLAPAPAPHVADELARRLPSAVHLHYPDLHAPECLAHLRSLRPDLGIVFACYRLQRSLFSIPAPGHAQSPPGEGAGVPRLVARLLRAARGCATGRGHGASGGRRSRQRPDSPPAHVPTGPRADR